MSNPDNDHTQDVAPDDFILDKGRLYIRERKVKDGFEITSNEREIQFRPIDEKSKFYAQTILIARDYIEATGWPSTIEPSSRGGIEIHSRKSNVYDRLEIHRRLATDDEISEMLANRHQFNREELIREIQNLIGLKTTEKARLVRLIRDACENM